MLEKIGIVLFVLGAMAADSVSILAPLSLMALGTGLYLVGKRLEVHRGK